jgi:hypothetical protein
MDPTDPPRAAQRSAGEWLFQLTTITVGVLIALSFDAVLRWNADRTLVNEALATMALEIADNRRELDAYLASFDERIAKLDNALKLLDELDAGVEPTVREVDLAWGFPSLNDAGWQTAERTGAIGLMQYPEVQRLAELYALQSLFTDTLQPAFIAANHAGAIVNAAADPYGMPPAARDAMRARVLELRAYLELGRQLSGQLADGYTSYQTELAGAK